MNMMKIASVGAALALAGCVCNDCPKSESAAPAEPVLGNWGLKLPYDSMNAGHMILSRNAKGEPEALVLWRWASPEKALSVKIDGNKFTVDHPWYFFLEGEVDGDKLTAKLLNKEMKDNKFTGKTTDGGVVTGWRNKPVCPCASTRDAKFGEPIDLLKDGLDGWKLMGVDGKDGKNGWSFKDGVLSNTLGFNKDGSWKGGGLNLMSKRADFFDFNLDYDVRVPTNSNSGVYLRGRYEIQTVDSFDRSKRKVKTPDCHDMAAYYGRVAPSTAAERKPGEWQHVNVTLFRKHLTVWLNGVKIIDDVPVVGITGGAIDANEDVPGPFYLQGDHSDADYKNMILRPAVN